jgi:hypothetical protein
MFIDTAYSKNNDKKLFFLDKSQAPKQPAKNCSIEVLTGVNVYDMQQSGYYCGRLSPRKTLELDGVLARYVQIQTHCSNTICELQVFGDKGIRFSL